MPGAAAVEPLGPWPSQSRLAAEQPAERPEAYCLRIVEGRPVDKVSGSKTTKSATHRRQVAAIGQRRMSAAGRGPANRLGQRERRRRARKSRSSAGTCETPRVGLTAGAGASVLRRTPSRPRDRHRVADIVLRQNERTSRRRRPPGRNRAPATSVFIAPPAQRGSCRSIRGFLARGDHDPRIVSERRRTIGGRSLIF